MVTDSEDIHDIIRRFYKLDRAHLIKLFAERFHCVFHGLGMGVIWQIIRKPSEHNASAFKISQPVTVIVSIAP